MYPSPLRIYSRHNIRLNTAIFAICFLLNGSLLFAQPNTTIDVPKPAKYDSRVLPAERTGENKFTAPRRFYNDLTSRFNYYFNANNKLNEIIEKAKAAHTDDYTELLPFYKYSLDVTAKDHLDSVIYKCVSGILLHDLRSDWVDKLYLLMGKAYLFRKNFDSATTVFQYINYAFAPKDDGYDIPIGSNASNTNGVFTIATKETKNLWKKIMSVPPSRNESFILQARNYIEQGKYIEATSLLEILRADPNFPARLKDDLYEMSAYVLYKQKEYTAAAIQLKKALVKPSGDRSEMARWEYLAGQLFQLGQKAPEAITSFESAIRHTSDPLMEVYARLNIVSLSNANEENALQRNLDELLRMAKRDKYEANRDVIYYAAAALELKRKNYTAAQSLLLKSIHYNFNNPLQRQESFLLLGDLNYTRKQYAQSYAFYDSIQVPLLKEIDKPRVKERKPALQIITENQGIISKQDSLQKLASLTSELRNTYLKKLLRQLRRDKGLKELDYIDPQANNNPSLFSGTGNGADFYFQNNSLKSRGFNDFKTQWGTRPNIDNWRRQSVVDRSMSLTTPLLDNKNAATNQDDKELTVESLLKNIPLTVAQKQQSNEAIIKALLTNALTFQNKLEDYPSAIQAYEELLRRFPESGEVEQILFNLSYCYRKNNQYDKAFETADLLKKSFAGGKYASQLEKGSISKKNDPAKLQYEDIYRMFIEGRFEEAKQAKQQADKQFGKTYWTPQLLFIESIYYVKQRQDSTAINRLQNLANLFPKTPLAEKAVTMIDVLRRRNQIENYLTNLNLNKRDDLVERGIDLDSTNPMTGLKIRKLGPYKAPTTIQNKIRDLVDITDRKTIAIEAPNKPKVDSLASVKVGLKPLTIQNIAKKPETTKANGFSFNPSDTQYVVVILEKVDPIFVSEGRNAFNRFNQERYPGQRIEIITRKINDQNQFLVFGPFADAAAAVTYIDATRPITSTRIIPWLTADKYSFSIISSANLQTLINTQDLAGYRAFIHSIFPDKF